MIDYMWLRHLLGFHPSKELINFPNVRNTVILDLSDHCIGIRHTGTDILGYYGDDLQNTPYGYSRYGEVHNRNGYDTLMLLTFKTSTNSWNIDIVNKISGLGLVIDDYATSQFMPNCWYLCCNYHTPRYVSDSLYVPSLADIYNRAIGYFYDNRLYCSNCAVFHRIAFQASKEVRSLKERSCLNCDICKIELY